MHLRHQLAVYSPVSLRAIGAATAAAVGWNHDAIDALPALLRREYSADEVVLCGSGTQALQLAIESARRELGQPVSVALPAFSCFDVASAAVGAGGPVILYDLDPLSLSPDLDSLERALAAGARVAVIAPLYGIPVDWDSIEDLASAHGSLLIEDAAQGHGATHRRRPLGSLGDISVLSFGRGKGWTGGSGGAALFRRGQTPSPIRTAAPGGSLRTASALAAQWGLGRPSVYGIPRGIPALSLGETQYREPREPAAMSRAAAAALLATRDESLREVQRRRENVETIRAEIAGHPRFVEVTSRAQHSSSGGLRFAVLARDGLGGFGDPSLVQRLGVAPSYPTQLGSLSQLGPLVMGHSELAGAARLVRELITLPTHSLQSSRDRAELAARVRGYGRS